MEIGMRIRHIGACAIFSNRCNHVVIDSAHTVVLKRGEIGYGYTFEVKEGAEFIMDDEAELEIEQ